MSDSNLGGEASILEEDEKSLKSLERKILHILMTMFQLIILRNCMILMII